MPFEPDDPHPYVTVFIPTWNGGELFEEVLRELKAQETSWPYEIFAIDSGSKDGTIDRLRRHGVRVTSIPNTEFDHGLTRNRAVHEARGEIVVLTVQDATPESRDWLQTLVSNFEDKEVAGAYCNQIPRPNCSPFLKWRWQTWVRGGGQPEVRQAPSQDAFWNELDHVERWRTIAFDNVASAVRRSVALEYPFPRRRFGEDVTWAKGAILAGYKIVMEPRVAVIHSHDNSIWYEFRRAYLDHQNVNNLVGLRLAPRLRNVFEYAAGQSHHLAKAVWADDDLSFLQKVWWTLKIPPFAFTQNLAQFLGPLSNLQGRRGLWRIWDKIAGHHV
ncbi:MAG: glycosyltransferase [Planctomycetes bacterium]|nr:glycosyltransferase [Planctomycetota bacterium]